MKKINLTLRKGWKFVPENEIIDKYAPVGAQIVKAEPQSSSAQSIQVSMYYGLHESSAKEEAYKMGETLGQRVHESEFQGNDAYILDMNFCGVSLMYIYLDIEDCIMKIRLEGTGNQVDSNWKWVQKYLSWNEDLENNNGNPMHGEPCLVPPAMLAQMVSFTKRVYKATRLCLPFLPSHFDFIVAASLTPALDEEELIEKVELDYKRHGGLHEIDYTALSVDTRKKLEQYENVYIGKMQDIFPVSRKMQDILVGVIDGEDSSIWAIQENLDENVNELLLSF